MSIYQQLLMYFLASDFYFLDQIEYKAAWEFLQVGVCGPEKFKFETEFYRSCRERYQREGGFRLVLPDEAIKEYFENYNVGYELLPAILFAHWVGLSKEQIHHIKHSRKNGDTAWFKLYKYITSEKANYIIYTDTGEVRAKAEEDSLMLIAESGQRYEISL